MTKPNCKQNPSVNQAKTAKLPTDTPSINLALFRQKVIADLWVSNDLDYALIDNSDLFKNWLRYFDRITGVRNCDEWFESISIRDKAGCLRVIREFLSSQEGGQYKESLDLNQQPDTGIKKQYKGRTV